MNKKQQAKFAALHQLLVSMSEHYLQATPDEQAFLETTVGAAVFYLPRSKPRHYSGFISPEALESGNECREHMFPRKIAGAALLSNPPETADELAEKCNSVYLRFNIVTSVQNKQLAPHQKKGVFKEPFDAYEKAGITLIKDPRIKS